MSERTGTNAPEPAPIPTAERPVWESVIDDMRARDNAGRAKYGTPLQASNGRDHLVDAYQESLDLAVYLRAEIERRDNLNAPGPHPPPGGVPAARPEGEPGAAAVFVDFAGVGREFERYCAETGRAEWFQAFILDKHTHPAPEGLAARMRTALGTCVRHLTPLPWVGGPLPLLDEAAAVERDATPAAVAALDRAAAENQDLRLQLNGALAERNALVEKCAAARAENVALRAFAESFALTAEAAVEAHESRGRGGQQVGFHGDFAHIPPSAVNRLRWWATRAREALVASAVTSTVERVTAESVALRAALSATMGPRETLCVECGPGVPVDPDGLCETCGATSTGAWLDEHLKRAREALEGSRP